MLCEMLKSKIHTATITDAHLEYNGSLSLCPKIREAANLLLGEKILVVNMNNGSRFETYIMKGKEGEICLNGPAVRLGQVGDRVVIMAFAQVEEKEAQTFKPTIVKVDGANKILS